MRSSEDVVIQSPLSFVGSARRLWRPVRHRSAVPAKAAVGAVMVCAIAVAWLFVAAWTVLFGLLVVPWRLLRRGQRRRKQEERRHRELMGR